MLGNKPIVIAGKLRRAAAGPVVDELICQSEFLNVSAQGTLAKGAGVVRGDLTKLAAQLGQLIDLRDLRLAGRLDGELRWQRGDQETLDGTGTLTLSNFELAAKNGLPWQEQQLVVKLAATGNWPANGSRPSSRRRRRWSPAGTSCGPSWSSPSSSFRGTRSGPCSCTRPASWRRGIPRLQPFFSLTDWRLAGGIKLDATAQLAARRLAAETIKVELTKFSAAGQGLTIDEPLVRLETQAAWDVPDNKLTATDATLTSSSAAFRADQLLLQFPAGVPAVSGLLSYRADLARLTRWTADPRRPPQRQWAGTLSGVVEAAHQADVTQLDWTADVKDLVYSAKATAAAPAATPVTLAGNWEELYREPAVKLAGLQKYDHRRDVLEVERLTAASSTFSLATTGKISELCTRRVADLNGQVGYDLKQLTEQLRKRFGSSIDLQGAERGQFRIRGPLAAVTPTATASASATASIGDGADARNASPATDSAAWVAPDLTGAAKFGWQAARLYGMEIGPGQLQAELERGILRTLPLDLAVGEGRFKLASSIDLSRSPATLVLPQGSVIENVQISPELCRGWLKFVAPMLADATAAEGRFSLTLDRGSVPLGDTVKSDIHGDLLIHTAQVGPGPLSQQFLTLAGQIKALLDGKPAGDNALGQTWLQVPEQKLHFDVQDGRVVHRDFTVTAGDVVIKTSGSVGLDQSLMLTAEVPVRDEWIAQRAWLGSLKGTVLKVPIGGAISQPRLDQRALADLNRQLLRNAAGGMLQNELNRGLDRLLRPRPSGETP